MTKIDDTNAILGILGHNSDVAPSGDDHAGSTLLDDARQSLILEARAARAAREAQQRAAAAVHQISDTLEALIPGHRLHTHNVRAVIKSRAARSTAPTTLGKVLAQELLARGLAITEATPTAKRASFGLSAGGTVEIKVTHLRT